MGFLSFKIKIPSLFSTLYTSLSAFFGQEEEVERERILEGKTEENEESPMKASRATQFIIEWRRQSTKSIEVLEERKRGSPSMAEILNPQNVPT